MPEAHVPTRHTRSRCGFTLPTRGVGGENAEHSCGAVAPGMYSVSWAGAKGLPTTHYTSSERRRRELWSGAGGSCNLHCAAAHQHAGNQRQGAAYHHDSGNDEERRHIIGGFGSPEAGNQDRADNATGAPGCKHGAIDRASVPGTEEVGGKSGHRAEATAVAQSNDSGQDEQKTKVSGDCQENKDDDLDHEHAQEGKGTPDTIREPAPEQASRRIEDTNDDDDGRSGDRIHAGELLGQGRGYRNQGRACGYVQGEDKP